MATDFYHSVPKTRQENLAYRLNLRKKAQKDAGLRRAIMAACKHDILFFFNFAAWLHEPRARFDESGKLLPKVFPFITWEHQDRAFRKARKALGVQDVGVEKCRAEGWTWFEVYAALQFWLFEDMSQVGLVSSTEKKSDSTNMGSIGGKIGWAVEQLPRWMTGVKGQGRTDGDWYRNLNEHTFVNLRNGSQIVMFAASPDTGRGDRFTWFGLDEHASDEWKKENKDERVLDAIGGATDSILYISTPRGAHGAFHRVMHEASNMVKITIDWRDNRTKNRGLYKLRNGVPVAVDSFLNPLPPEYNPPTQEILDLFSRLRKKGFDLESKTRSPWLDRECDRAQANPQSIAQEHERDYGGSQVQIFGKAFMEKAAEGPRPPDVVGMLSVFDEDYSFDRVDGGAMHLWCQLDVRNRPPAHQYVVCADVASGEGGQYCSNSALIVIDLVTREQVLEYVTKTEKPSDLADRAIAICKWFHGAYLAWENMGPGAAFTARVKERQYGYCYERETLDKATRKKSKKLGFDNRGAAREALFGDLERMIRSGDLTIRSKYLLDEFSQYIRDDKGKITHNATDSGDSTHGDRVIAIGVGVQAMKDRPVGKAAERTSSPTDVPAEGTIARRLWERKQDKDKDDPWDHRSSAQLVGEYAYAG